MGQLVQSFQGQEGVGRCPLGEAKPLEGPGQGVTSQISLEDTSLEVNTYEAPVARLTHVVST